MGGASRQATGLGQFFFAGLGPLSSAFSFESIISPNLEFSNGLNKLSSGISGFKSRIRHARVVASLSVSNFAKSTFDI